LDRLEQRELSAVRWLLGQAVLLVALSGSYFLQLGADLLITVAIVMVLVACLIPRMVESIPGVLWRILPGFLLIAIVTDFLLAGGDLLAPLFRMVILLSLYRGMQIRTPREDLQLLLLSLFLLIVTGVLSQEVTFAVQLLAFAPAAMGLLFAVNLAGQDHDSTKGPVFKGFRWAQLLYRIRQRFDYRTFYSGILLFLAMTGMSLLFFILMPRFDIGAALPFPRLKASTSLSGFTDRVEYGDVVSILEDDGIAMRVDVEAPDPPARPYWRMLVLDAYYDGGFLVSPRVAREHREVDHYRFEFTHRDHGVSDQSVWTIYFEGSVSSYLPASERFNELRFNNRTTLHLHDLTRVHQADEVNATTLSLRYTGMQFDGVVPFGIDDDPLLGMPPVYVDTSGPGYLKDVAYPVTQVAVPGGVVNQRIIGNALDQAGLRDGMPVGEITERLVDFLQAGRGYSLQSRIPDGEADHLLRWIESGRPGHCELYAGAFVLLSRSAGVPARMVTGFVGGDWNGFENYYMVRHRNAHAWCEVLDPQRGWVRVDPTPGYGLDQGSIDDALAGGRLSIDRTFGAYLDSLRILWFRRVIQFDQSDQEEMAELAKSAGLKGFSWFKDMLGRLKKRWEKDVEFVSTTGNWMEVVKDGALVIVFCAGILTTGFFLIRNRRVAHFESRVRKQAGRLLRERDLRGLSPGVPEVEVVERIRYGPVSAWPDDPIRRIRESRKAVNQPL
jgi:hypothetical protein